MDDRPLLAVTLGVPAGIGPAIIVKTLLNGGSDAWDAVIVGAAGPLQAAAQVIGRPLTIQPVSAPREARQVRGAGAVALIEATDHDLTRVDFGRVDASYGAAAMDFVRRATELALAGEVDAIVTAPINKEAIHAAGYQEAGHMEFLQRLTAAPEQATMLVSGTLYTVHLTTHVSLRQACELVTRDRVLSRLRLTDREFRGWGYQEPRIAVAALNPHGSDGGLFGNEEAEQIAPAIADARAEGIHATGPHPADSVFHRAIRGEFDVVLAMFHDQGHIPIKVHGFEESVSVALGLPIIRTSVDHGTAFDIAGQGVAQERSLVEALWVAANLVTRRARAGASAARLGRAGER